MQSEILSNEVPAWDFESMTAEDFLKEDWLEYLARIYLDENQTKLNIELEKFDQTGKALGFRRAIKFWNGFLEDHAGPRDAGSDLSTEFAGQPMRLDSGNWTCDDRGIRTFDGSNQLIACRHPILPIERIVNVDTKMQMLRLAYTRTGPNRWKTDLVVPKSVLASPQRILDLADRGISVTSDNAKHLISYLQEIEDLNYAALPEQRAVARLGWINDKEFSPYAEGLQFDETADLKQQFRSVQPTGDYELWLDTVRTWRSRNIVFRIMTAASFASVILKKMSVLPAFVHLWADLSSSGKSVALMMAASVWGNPESGEYMQSFNSTTTGLERLSEFYNSLPLCLDELQQAKDDNGRKRFNVYKLTQGSGRTRGTKVGGIEKTTTWRNFILTTGESQLVDMNEGEGAMARVVNIELKDMLMTLDEAADILGVIKENYGHAGKRFVEELQDPDTPYTDEVIKELYRATSREISSRDDVQSKQAMSVAAIIVGDMLASQIIFDDEALTVDDMLPFMARRSETSLGNRALELIRGWIAQNQNMFLAYSSKPEDLPVGNIYGVIEGDYTYINGPKFDEVMELNGFSPKSVLKSWARYELIRVPTSGRGEKVVKKIKGVSTKCVALKNDPDDNDLTIKPAESYTLPF